MWDSTGQYGRRFPNFELDVVLDSRHPSSNISKQHYASGIDRQAVGLFPIPPTLQFYMRARPLRKSLPPKGSIQTCFVSVRTYYTNPQPPPLLCTYRPKMLKVKML